MFSNCIARFSGVALLALALAATASAQYGGGGGGTGGSGGGSGSGTYSSRSYGNTARNVGIGVGAAAGVTAAILLVRHHHKMKARNEASLIGCTQSAPKGLTLMNETDHQTYSLVPGKFSIAPGERVQLTGQAKAGKSSDNSSAAADPQAFPQAFKVRSIVKDYGACPANPVQTAER